MIYQFSPVKLFPAYLTLVNTQLNIKSTLARAGIASKRAKKELTGQTFIRIIIF